MPFSNLLYHLFWLELALYGTKQSGLITFERANVVIAAVYFSPDMFFLGTDAVSYFTTCHLSFCNTT